MNPQETPEDDARDNAEVRDGPNIPLYIMPTVSNFILLLAQQDRNVGTMGVFKHEGSIIRFVFLKNILVF